MYKVVWLARFAKGLDTAEGRRRWAATHVGFDERPDLGGYIRNFATESFGTAAPLAIDGYSCCFFKDEAQFERFNEHTLMRMSPEQGPGTFDMDHMVGMSAVLREHPVIEGPTGPFKCAWVFRLKDAYRADARRYLQSWISGPWRVPGATRLLHNVVEHRLGISPGDAGGDRADFDVLTEAWFQEQPSFEWQRPSDLFDVSWTEAGHAVRLEEFVVKAP